MLLCFLYPFSCGFKWGSHNSHFPSTQESWCDGDIAKVRAGHLPFPCCHMKESWAWDALLLVSDSLVIPGQEPPSMGGFGILCQRQELSGVEFRKDQEEIITCMSGNCTRKSSSVLKNSNICPLKDRSQWRESLPFTLSWANVAPLRVLMGGGAVGRSWLASWIRGSRVIASIGA